MFFDADGTLEEFEIDAQGGVVAGNLKVKNTRLSCEFTCRYIHVVVYVCIPVS